MTKNPLVTAVLLLWWPAGVPWAAPPPAPPQTVEVIRLSRSDIGGDLYHCIRAGLRTYGQVRLVDHDPDWQVKIAVTTRPFLGPDMRLLHLTLLHRADGTSAPEDHGDNAHPIVQGYRIESAVIRQVPRFGFADTCQSVVTDLIRRHLSRER